MNVINNNCNFIMSHKNKHMKNDSILVNCAYGILLF